MQPRKHRHLGVYGFCIVSEHILLIRKVRGPYQGLMDLPGGGVEFGEELETALRREFIEETGLVIAHASLRLATSNQINYVADDGVTEELHHIGILYEVVLNGIGESPTALPVPKLHPDGQDSGGAMWMPLKGILGSEEEMLTPFARTALKWQVVEDNGR